MTLVYDHDSNERWMVYDADLPDSAGAFCRDVKSRNDAALIAAAPDMLAALKEYLLWGAMTGTDRERFYVKFRKAVAKAEGGKP